MRLSIETYPGIRRSYVIFPAALTGHGLVVVYFVLTRVPYDRLALLAGFVLHVLWLYLLYIYAERNIRRRIAVVPLGAVGHLTEIANEVIEAGPIPPWYEPFHQALPDHHGKDPAEGHRRHHPNPGWRGLCDLERHVFNAEHTDPKVAEALRATHWYDLREWTTTGPGSTAQG